MLNGYYSAKKYPEHLRRIRFKDPESGKTLVFLTNNTALPALTICALYKSRWQVELFFKWIKQHLRIKHFLGNSENAVKTQVWCAVATYVLIAIVKKELQLDASLYTCLQILSVSVFEKTQISCALQPDTLHNDMTDRRVRAMKPASNVDSPSTCVTCAGVPSASSVPLCRTSMRSATSASSTQCVAHNTHTPRSRTSACSARSRS